MLSVFLCLFSRVERGSLMVGGVAGTAPEDVLSR